MNRTLKTGFFFLLAVMSLMLVSACASVEETDTSNGEKIGQTQQGLTTAEKYARVINECSQAMTGSWWTYTTSNWPRTTTYANYAYTSSDLGAWDLLRTSTAYSGSGTTGYYVSCLYVHPTKLYSPCYLTLFGSSEMPSYTCQGSCSASSKMHGGQCKAFSNLVAYRSGIYQGSSYAFKAFPGDSTVNGYPLATYANVIPGDFVRRTVANSVHSAVVVSVISSTQAIVLDSNWTSANPSDHTNGNGDEVVSSHAMSFSGGGLGDLSTYHVMKCVYTGGC